MPAEEQVLFKVEPDSPDRCQATGQIGQCPFRVVEGTKYCPRHGGGKAAKTAEQKKIRNYNLTLYQARVNNFADNEQVKSLREEIGILRMMLETVLNRCESDNDLVVYCQRITELVTKIQGTVVACNRLEETTGQLMDRAAVLNIASRIVNIISKHIDDSDILNIVVTEIMGSINAQDQEELEG